MLTVILSIIISALALFGLFCSLSLVMGLRVKEKYRIAVWVRSDAYGTHLAAKRAEMVLDGNRHMKSPPVILANKGDDRAVLHTLALEYGYEIYIREEANGNGYGKGDGVGNG